MFNPDQADRDGDGIGDACVSEPAQAKRGGCGCPGAGGGLIGLMLAGLLRTRTTTRRARARQR